MDFFFLRCLKNRSQKYPCLEFSAWPLSEPLKGLPVWGVQPSTLRQFCSEKEVKSFGSHFTLLEQFRKSTFTFYCSWLLTSYPSHNGCACFLPFCQDSSVLLGGICGREGERKRARKRGKGEEVCVTQGNWFVNAESPGVGEGAFSICPQEIISLGLKPLCLHLSAYAKLKVNRSLP